VREREDATPAQVGGAAGRGRVAAAGHSGRGHVAQASLGEHLAIITAIARRRPDEAEHAMRRHLRSVMGALLDHHQPGNTARQTGGR
jgi:DNA-binding GntR family transcriptional regulator